ncbi:MAG: UDP-N-acetylmuramate dehydrogenase [Lachnospiraceae bacterium]|nr:UDP-N-acetylmuramate dehydrogenase [Lachnospiraceae bacterium]
MENNFYTKLCEINGQDHVLQQEPMKRHTTFRIGGPAKYYVTPTTVEALQGTLKACIEAQQPHYVLGNGSNVLVSDAGYDGVIIQLFKNRNDIRIEGQRVVAQAGALLTRISHEAARAGLTGLEFASGIPGTLGGALVMNAGAYGGEMKDVVEKVLVLTPEAEVCWLQKEELELGYRTSVIARKDYIVLEAVLHLEQGDTEQILACMEELKEARVTKQPLEYPSAGSTFKRPEGYFAGKLIMDAGLRGYQIGGAQVAEKHCGFVINRGEATAQDVLDLVAYVKQKVKNQFGVELELEVKLLGFED